MLLQILQLAGWFVALVMLMSLMEHQTHQRLMHKKPRNSLLKKVPARNRIFTSHAVEHHTQYRKDFHDDPVPAGKDHGIRLNIIEGLGESLPVSLVLVWFSVTAAVMFPMVLVLHHVIWNLVHMEMHKPEKRLFANWSLYKFMARQHFLHHRYPDKNFNVAFPTGDFLCGTIAKPTNSDWDDMRAEGIA